MKNITYKTELRETKGNYFGDYAVDVEVNVDGKIYTAKNAFTYENESELKYMKDDLYCFNIYINNEDIEIEAAEMGLSKEEKLDLFTGFNDIMIYVKDEKIVAYSIVNLEDRSVEVKMYK